MVCFSWFYVCRKNRKYLQGLKEVQEVIKTYIKKPVEVQAVQWTGSNFDEVESFAEYQNPRFDDEDNTGDLYVDADPSVPPFFDRQLVAVGSYFVNNCGTAFILGKDCFESAYTQAKNTGLTFGEALDDLKEGYTIWRKGWPEYYHIALGDNIKDSCRTQDIMENDWCSSREAG